MIFLNIIIAIFQTKILKVSKKLFINKTNNKRIKMLIITLKTTFTILLKFNQLSNKFKKKIK